MQDSLDLLEWPSLFDQLLNECLTPYGVQAWLAEPVLSDIAGMEAHQRDVDGLNEVGKPMQALHFCVAFC